MGKINVLIAWVALTSRFLSRLFTIFDIKTRIFTLPNGQVVSFRSASRPRGCACRVNWLAATEKRSTVDPCHQSLPPLSVEPRPVGQLTLPLLLPHAMQEHAQPTNKTSTFPFSCADSTESLFRTIAAPEKLPKTNAFV
jgi:hypothetical protein